MSSIVTFYSYKGGVGRTMAVANIAILLAQLGLRTLVVDWDLEAPGIERYFRNWQTKRDGLLTLLTEAASTVNQESKPNWRDYVSIIDKGYKCPLSVITSGYSSTKNYAQKILSFDWNSFFKNANGGEYIESLRNDWLE
ncbi:MAG: AAA family ATPase [Prochloron sp. SP5CPC1]|nr:AAA family ATPase [Candidatus Paraprochloron terpiosi SP5CPC1]